MSNIKVYKDHWTKLDDLSSGGQGITIKAKRNFEDNTIAALKILQRQGDNERRARMHRESTILSTLDHPCLPKFFDCNTEYWKNVEYKLFIALEFIDGVVLSKIDFVTIDFYDKIDLIIKICDTISYCHKKGIVHRDIKPDNVVLRDSSLLNPVVLDFGLSFNFEDQDDDILTPDGQHLGNRFLILPEQKVGEVEKRDARSDVTQIVGLFYYTLCSHFPTVLEDQAGQKPHQRDPAVQAIRNLPLFIQPLINDLFDVGFNPLINKRWQTIDSLTTQLIAIRNAKDIKLKTTEDNLRYIKEQEERPDYILRRNTKLLLQAAEGEVRLAFNNFCKTLGGEWVSSFATGEIPKYQSKGYGVRHIICNRITRVMVNFYWSVFVTGSEIVIRSLVEDDREIVLESEVFRYNLESQPNWEILHSQLTAQYSDALANRIRLNQ